MTEDKGETIRLVKFDGEDANWHEWSVKTLALAKTRGFKNAYMKDTNPCSDAVYETTDKDDVKKIYEMNDRAYQLLIMSCTGIAFGLVNQAKTKNHQDGDAFLAWTYLKARYVPNATSDLIQLSGQFNKCICEGKTQDPDEWFIQLELLRNRMATIDSAYEKKDLEMIAHILDKLPKEYSEVVTMVEAMPSLTLEDLKAKIRAFFKRKFKNEKSDGELALAAFGTKFKGLCRSCGKQGHKAADCRVKNKTHGDGNRPPPKGVKCFNCNKHAGHIAKDCPEPKRERTTTKETGMFVGMCTIDYEDIEANEKKQDMNDKYNENDDKEWTFVGICEEIIDDCDVKFNNKEFCASAVAPRSIALQENWLADTGATAHITMSDVGMTNVRPVSVTVVVGDGSEIKCTKRGDIKLTNGEKTMTLKDVLYTPKFHKNIVSLGVLIRDGFDLSVTGSTMTVKKGRGGHISFNRETNGVLYYFKGSRASYADVVSMVIAPLSQGADSTKNLSTNTHTVMSGEDKMKSQDINEAHDIYGHIGEAALRATFKALKIELTGTLRSCDGCSKAKAKAKAVSKVSTVQAVLPGERIFVDTSGPYKKSIVGSNYWILVVDQFSGKSWSFFVKKKNLLSKIVDELLIKLFAAKYVIKYLRCDNAGENLENLSSVCTKHGIQIEYTAPNTPQQNGVVERKFVTIRDRSCAAMINAKLNDEFQGLLWAECANTMTRVTNVVSNSRNIKCPDWLWYGKQPTIYEHLIQFGRIGYVTIRTPVNKLDDKAIKCVMIGYSENHSGDTYRLFNPITKKVIQSRDVKWIEWHGETKPTNDLTMFKTGIDEIEFEEELDQPVAPTPTVIPDDETGSLSTLNDLQVSEAGRNEASNTSKPAITRAERELKKLGHETAPTMSTLRSGRFHTIVDDDHDLDSKPTSSMEVHYIYSSTLASDPGEPKTYSAALKADDREKWIPAIKSEINNFIKRKVWSKFPRSELHGRKPLGSRWVFKKKKEQDLTTRYKARVVVKGYIQIPGVDFTDSFAPVATDTSIRVVFAITMHKKTWTLEVIDVEASFLEGDLEEDIYLEWPEGVVEFGFEDNKVVSENCILLSKAMYGTVQAARQWYKKLVERLILIGMKQSKVDPCIFFLKRDLKLILIVCIYVDDCIVAGEQADVDWLKAEAKKHFTIKELGPIKKHLGVWYDWGEDADGRFLESTMEDFVEGMFEDYKNLFGRYPAIAPTPGLPGTSLSKNDAHTVLHSEYRSMVGKILYFVKKISPICANACRELSQHLENPGEAHWKAVERLLGFLYADKKHRRMKMRTPKEMRPMDVVDSAFAINPDTRKSTSAYLGTIGARSLVTWSSKGQNIVTTSSTEAEYVSLSDGVKDTTFVTNLLDEVYYVELPAIIAEDNTGAICFPKQKPTSWIKDKAY